jgi:hypothetical protein
MAKAAASGWPSCARWRGSHGGQASLGSAPAGGLRAELRLPLDLASAGATASAVNTNASATLNLRLIFVFTQPSCGRPRVAAHGQILVALP